MNEQIDKIELTDDGYLLVTQSVEKKITRKYKLTPVKAEPRLSIDEPTPRELEVLELLVAGYTNREVAEELIISVRTAESHRANLMGKLGLTGRRQLVQYWKDNYEHE